MRTSLLALAVLLACAALLEGGARLALWTLGEGGAPIELGWQRGDAGGGHIRDIVYVPDAELFFRLAPGLALETTANPRIFDLRTNALGLRGRETSREKPTGVTRVLAVGDSCTFGSGAGDAGTFPAQLEARLAQARPDLRVEVLNAGVPGFSSHQALRYLELDGFGFAPDAVVFTTGVNDASPATAGGKRGFGDGRMLSDQEYAEALTARDRLGVTRLLWRAGLWAGGGADADERGVKRRVSPARYRANLERFAAASRARGALPLIVAWPLQTQASGAPEGELERVVGLYQQTSGEAARDAGALWLDLRPALAGHPELFIDVVHLSPSGYARVADAVAAALLAALPAP